MVNVGIIGLGGIAQGKHIKELQQIKEANIVAICDIDVDRLNDVGDRLNIPADRRFTDYKELIACGDVEAVEVCTPNHLHVPMAVDAVRAGKAINVEKPLSINKEQAQLLADELKKNPVKNMMCFSYRFMPAVRYAKYILDKKMIGNINGVHIAYLKNSAFFEGRRLDWRFVKEYAGTGVLGDLGVHLIDMAAFLLGDFHEVSAMTGIVVKERKRLDSEELAPVETDDYCNFIATLGDGIAADFAVTRCALGNANTIKFDIFGDEGAISFNLNDPDILNVCIGEVDKQANCLHTVTVPQKFKIMQEQMFIDMVSGKECEFLPTVEEGLKCQKILDALLQSSEEKRWITL